MRKNKWYWVIGVMTAVALGITLDMYYHTARKQRGELLSLIAVIVSIFTLAATIFIALYIYNKPGDLSYRVAWIIPILFVPVVGLILYLLWGGDTQRKRLQLSLIHISAPTRH